MTHTGVGNCQGCMGYIREALQYKYQGQEATTEEQIKQHEERAQYVGE